MSQQPNTPRAMLTEEDVREIRASDEPSRAIALRLEVSEVTILAARRRHTYRHVA